MKTFWNHLKSYCIYILEARIIKYFMPWHGCLLNWLLIEQNMISTHLPFVICHLRDLMPTMADVISGNKFNLPSAEHIVHNTKILTRTHPTRTCNNEISHDITTSTATWLKPMCVPYNSMDDFSK